ncbi:MAG TPA: ABC transporter ATP-binding protein [Candidatus Lumbricidophila sp.]|nr:ABC transporter ATP-binding protein [Candidatus Lumbricidophila sp.]
MVHAVRDVSLTVHAGEFVSIMGPSGCGKSTLLGLLAGLDVPDSGSVRLLGGMLSNAAPDKRASLRLRNVGLVFQDHQLVPEFTCAENVMLPLELQGQHHFSAKGASLEALGLVGVAELADRFPSDISGGQRQRVGVARATVGGRRLILADEATGSLDARNSELVFSIFRDLADTGYAVIAATHDLTIRQYAHRGIQMADGTLEPTADVDVARS